LQAILRTFHAASIPGIDDGSPFFRLFSRTQFRLPQFPSEGAIMWNLHYHLRRTIERLTGNRPRRPAIQSLVDWLPPVLGPQDWQIGLFADRDAAWYFDRDRA
jgi:hypothetical protein